MSRYNHTLFGANRWSVGHQTPEVSEETKAAALAHQQKQTAQIEKNRERYQRNRAIRAELMAVNPCCHACGVRLQGRDPAAKLYAHVVEGKLCCQSCAHAVGRMVSVKAS